MLKWISPLRDGVESWDAYRVSMPAVRASEDLEIHSRMCCFAGENGSGKSTLLVAIAANYDLGRADILV